MSNISKHISNEEATKSYTAEKYGIDNTPSNCTLDRMRKAAESVFEPLREHFNIPIGIASFYRSKALNKLIGGVKRSEHCFDSETEVLTDNGWKNINTFDLYKDKLFTYNTKENLIEPLYGNELIIINYNDYVITGTNKHIDYVVDPKHRMYVDNTGQSNKFNFETAKRGLNKRRIHKVASNKREKSNIFLPSLDIVKFSAAVVADGAVYTKKGAKHPYIVFNIKKERKMDELEYLLRILDIKYNKRYCKSREKQGQYGVYEYTIAAGQVKNIISIIEGKNKKLPLWFLSYNSKELREIVDTYSRFDGTVDSRNDNTGITIFSKNEHTIDLFQAMSILSNRRAVKKELLDIETTYGKMDKFYNLFISEHNTSRLNEYCTSKKLYKGVLWSVNNNNTTLITRRNGKVFITGNCLGQAIDIDADIYGQITNKQIFEYIYNNLCFNQLISEFPDETGEPKWVHVSYDYKGNNKQEALVAYKEGKRTKYKYYAA